MTGFKRINITRYKIVIIISFLIFMFLYSKMVVVAAKNDYPYVIKVNRVHNTITVYEKDEKGEYSRPIKAMLCSVGTKSTPTPLGTYQTMAKYRWKALMGNVWGQYSTRIVRGILFHSVYYYNYADPSTLATKEFNKLGQAASHGCIRITVEDAKWIYDNCPIGTTVIIYDDKNSPGPLGKPEGIKLPSNVRWDPTDPDVNNPYYAKTPELIGIKDRTISWGEEIDLYKNIKAKSSVGSDITSKILVEGRVNPYKSGDYQITYRVTDSLGRMATQSMVVTVKENPYKAVFDGANNQVVGKETKIDRTFALSGVNVYLIDKSLDTIEVFSNEKDKVQDAIKMNPDEVQVDIKEVKKDVYQITYQVSYGENESAMKVIQVYVDRTGPVFSGISERTLRPFEIPDRNWALEGVRVHDDFTRMKPDDIIVTIEGNPDGSYWITYEARDKAGNKTIESVVCRYDGVTHASFFLVHEFGFHFMKGRVRRYPQ